jgi:DNA processing protein
MDNIITIKIDSPKYPRLLREINRAPQKLYARGNIDLLDSNCFAVVGTRSCSISGETNARFFTRGLVSYNLTIVSGLAFGIDAVAHQETVQHGGKTIAVLGSGIDNIRPAANEHIARDILDKNGLILSEYGPGVPTYTSHYPARNRLISGLSVGTLVVEAPDKSGALITAKRAFEQNREVFAIPGSLQQETMRGNNFLLANDIARLARSPEEIIAHLREQPKLLLGDLNKEIATARKANLKTTAQKAIFSLFQHSPTTPFHPEDVLKKTKLSISEVWVALSYLEIKGHIKNVGQGFYAYST